MTTQEITKVQELIYTTRVETVMATNVVVVDPSMTMGEVKRLMQEKRISGAPVMRGDTMVGIVSMTDVLDVTEQGLLGDPVTRHMTREVKTILKDSSVLEAVSNLDRQGFARLPVVDQNGRLVGIVTTGTMIRALLREMDISFQKKEAEKLQSYRARHIFQDIVSDDTSVILRFVVAEKDFDNAGKAASAIKKSLQRLGVIPSIVRRVAVAVYEAEMNLVIHTDVGGVITVDVRSRRIKINAVDHGPGIEDVVKVLQPGYSTAPEWIRDMGFGAGMGLANIKRCADVMKLLSGPGSGTRLDIEFLLDNDGSGGRMDASKKT
ncbi:MAG: CBS domain-containing protein [Desulfomonilaceae bacterium]|nr:CBS domain-containing protein [Desulfomonilaceae bacterium]